MDISPPEKQEFIRTEEPPPFKGHELLELAAANKQSGTADSTTMTMEYGSIEGITLNGQWKKYEYKSQLPQVKEEYFSHGSDADLSVIRHEYWLTGAGKDDETGAALHKVLSQPDHKLTKSEIKEIRGSLITAEAESNYLSFPFDIKDGWTKNVNGTPVLFVEGVYKTGPGKGGYELSAYPTSSAYPGSLPECLSFATYVKGDYDNFVKTDPARKQVLQAMESMHFKPPGTYETEIHFLGK